MSILSKPSDLRTWTESILLSTVRILIQLHQRASFEWGEGLNKYSSFCVRLLAYWEYVTQQQYNENRMTPKTFQDVTDDILIYNSATWYKCHSRSYHSRQISVYRFIGPSSHIDNWMSGHDWQIIRNMQVTMWQYKGDYSTECNWYGFFTQHYDRNSTQDWGKIEIQLNLG